MFKKRKFVPYKTTHYLCECVIKVTITDDCSEETFKRIHHHCKYNKGAKLVNNYRDILEEIHMAFPQKTCEKATPEKDISLSEEEKILYRLITKEPIQIDEIIEISKLSVGKVSEILLNLELKDIIKEIEGKRFIKL